MSRQRELTEGDKMNRSVWSMAVAAVVMWAGVARAQTPNQFGGQDRANAIRQGIIVGVQQGISSLPPTSGQSFVYEYDTSLGVSVPTETLGPTSFRSPQTLAEGKLSLRGAYSYFNLEKTVNPQQYLAEVTDAPGTFHGIVGFGVKASAQVSLFNLAATYGLLKNLDVMINIPITVVNASGYQISSTRVSNAGLPANQAQLAGFFASGPLSSDPAVRQEQLNIVTQGYNDSLAPPDGNCDLGPANCLTYRTDSLNSLGFAFNTSTGAGVGRIDLGAKYQIYGGGSDNPFDLAGSLEFFTPSPSQDNYAGSDTAAILPRLIAQARLFPHFRLHMDAGYNGDFGESQLSSFVWNFGASVPIDRFVGDLGFGGSYFNAPIHLNPQIATGSTNASGVQNVTLTALEDTGLGSNYVDFLFGLKYRITEQWVISGAVNVPINDQGFRAAAVGTVAAEVYF